MNERRGTGGSKAKGGEHALPLVLSRFVVAIAITNYKSKDIDSILLLGRQDKRSIFTLEIARKWVKEHQNPVH